MVLKKTPKIDAKVFSVIFGMDGWGRNVNILGKLFPYAFFRYAFFLSKIIDNILISGV